MQTYKVLGDSLTNYSIIVEAVDSDAAYDLAASMNLENWTKLETNSVVDPHTVELLDDDNLI